jgi:hypothetical protein
MPKQRFKKSAKGLRFILDGINPESNPNAVQDNSIVGSTE